MEVQVPTREETTELVAALSAVYARVCTLDLREHDARVPNVHAALSRWNDVLVTTRSRLQDLVDKLTGHDDTENSRIRPRVWQALDAPARAASSPRQTQVWEAVRSACQAGLRSLGPHATTLMQAEGNGALVRAERARREVCSVLSQVLDLLVEARSLPTSSASAGHEGAASDGRRTKTSR